MSQALQLPRSVSPDLTALIDKARVDLRRSREKFQQQRLRLNRLLSRRAEMLDRADARFNTGCTSGALDALDALETALSGEGDLTTKLATGMRICADCGAGVSPDIDDHDDGDEPTDDDTGDDSVLRNPGCTSGAPDYDAEGRTAEQLLHDRHGDATQAEMARAFAQDAQRWTQEMTQHEHEEFPRLQTQSQKVYADASQEEQDPERWDGLS